MGSFRRRELCDRSKYGSSREDVCGRPLGLQFNHKTGELYVADAYLGLLSVAAGGNHTKVVATEAQGVPFRFTNAVDIDQETGTVYFTDSSTRFQRREFILATITGDKTGRLMRYDPATGELQVLLGGLSFPNGVALSRDGTFLLVVETIPCRVLRYWLRTPRAGTVEVFSDLPGFPDNIKRSPRGDFWVALHSKRSKFLQWVLPLPWLGEALRRVPVDVERVSYWFLKWAARASALRLGEEGEVLEVLGGMGGRELRFISEIEEREGRLWMGSVVMPHVGVYKTTRKAREIMFN
ncbi:hypothetical protein Taro_035705 [Colocasia esculenta]|uniref:Strictosidine synthase conserved region domain-containing protein n=1 Tax=Colocasia esculenta TaxID=4460 RepID=A0A843VZM6_COLES|nr:hypothetical protein [Colocasia esculenta]